MISRRLVLTAAAAGVLTLAACGSEPASPTTAPTPAPPPEAPTPSPLPATAPSQPAREAMQQSVAAFKKGDFRGALELASRALADSPGAVEPYRLVSKIYTDIGRDRDGVEFFRRVAAAQPGAAHAWFYMGFHQFHLHLWEEALASFERAIEIDPSRASYHGRRGLILEYMGDLEGAAAAFETAYTLEPGSAQHAFRHVGGLRTLGRYDEAEEVLDAALARSPDAAELHYALGQLRVRGGRDAEAETALRRAIELDPRHPKAHKELAGLLFRSGRETEARRELAVSARLTDYIRRKSFLMERVGVNRDNDLLPLLLAELDLTEGRHLEALNWFARAESTGGPSDRIHAGRAETLLALGRRADAEAELSRIGDPEGTPALLARATSLVVDGDAAGALALLDRAVEGTPTSRDLVRRASDLYLRAGKAERAFELLELAMKVPRVPTP